MSNFPAPLIYVVILYSAKFLRTIAALLAGVAVFARQLVASLADECVSFLVRFTQSYSIVLLRLLIDVNMNGSVSGSASVQHGMYLREL